jgi:mevalonate kinase
VKNDIETTTIRARGKLLLTGEYAVLDGALALAVPVRFGQMLEVVVSADTEKLHWESIDEQGATWFKATFSLPALELLETTSSFTAERLQGILAACRKQNPEFLTHAGWKVRTRTDFPRRWGLGTSSTLIAALARWAGVDPYAVLFDTFGGSGYDIACAFAEGPLVYRLADQQPHVQSVHFVPAFASSLCFVFLGKKQNSREGIQRYRERAQGNRDFIEKITALTQRAVQAETLADFSAVMLEHEQLISRMLDLPRAQDLYFPDFPGVVKSLGAWGGDFVLAMSAQAPDLVADYFLKKGFSTCLAYQDMVVASGR